MRTILHATLAALLLVLPAQATPFITADPPAQVAGLRITTVVEGLERPWGLVFLPDGSALVTERPGRLRLIRDGALLPTPIAGTPPVLAAGQGGLFDVALDPNFATNRVIYLSYAHGDAQANRARLARAVLDGTTLRDLRVIFEVSQAKPGNAHFGGRIVFLPDGTLLLSTGDGGNPPNSLEGRFIREQAQNPGSHLGKILRLNADGSVPRDNPFLGRAGFAPEIWSMGHRNVQGMTWDTTRRVVLANEHGSQGGDELNLLRGGQNHGWPMVSYSLEYRGGAQIGSGQVASGMVDPVLVWSMTTAPSGLVVYTGDRFPAWRGDIFSGSLRSMDVRRIRADATGRVTGEEVIKIGRRVRDVRQGPDGFLYALTDDSPGAVLRIEAAR